MRPIATLPLLGAFKLTPASRRIDLEEFAEWAAFEQMLASGIGWYALDVPDRVAAA